MWSLLRMALKRMHEAHPAQLTDGYFGALDSMSELEFWDIVDSVAEERGIAA